MTSTLKTEKLQFRGDNSDAITFASSGKVGIGTTSPSETLHVKGFARVESNAGDAAYVRFVNDVNSGGKTWRAGAGLSAHGTFSIYNQTDNKFGINVNSNGHVTKPNQPSFVVSYNNNSYNWGGTTNGSLVKMAFNSTGTNGHNTGSLWNTSNTRMEAPVAGRYHVGVQWFNNYTSDYARVGAHISINGSTKHQSYVAQWETTGGNNCAAIVNLSANDYVEFWGSIHDNNATGNSWTGYGGAIETYGYGYLIG